MRPTQLFSVILCSGSALASPLATEGHVLVARGKIVTAQAAIEAIMLESKTCDGAKFPDECRTAAQAAPFLIDAMKGFSLGQIAAMLALIGVESGDLKSKHNIDPGVPGQGTSNMMSPAFIKQYATAKFGEEAVQGKTPTEVLGLVTPDEYNFGSAPWFFTTICSKDIQDKLLGGTQEGWEAYMSCVGVPADAPERVPYWERAQKVFGLNGF